MKRLVKGAVMMCLLLLLALLVVWMAMTFATAEAHLNPLHTTEVNMEVNNVE